MSDSKIQVGIVQDMLGDGISLTVRIKEDSTFARYMRVSIDGYPEWEGKETDSTHVLHPTMRLNDDIARAMLQALMHHYQGAEDLRTVRGDLLHERKRVDRLVEVLADTLSSTVEALVNV